LRAIDFEAQELNGLVATWQFETPVAEATGLWKSSHHCS